VCEEWFTRMRAARMRCAAAAGCHAAALQLALERLGNLRGRARGLAAAVAAQRKQQVWPPLASSENSMLRACLAGLRQPAVPEQQPDCC
jgi:hypothetical protein